MPKKRRPKVPSYTLHKATGQSVVRLGGKDHYLGVFGSPESHDEYNRVVAEWLAQGRKPLAKPRAEGVRIVELIAAYWQHVEGYYVKDDRPTNEQANIRISLRRIKEFFGRLPASEFGPLKLKALRQNMIEADLSRGYINDQVACMKRMFKWGVENELVPPLVYHGLQAVSGLKRGRTEARETEPVKPAPEPHVEAVKPHVSRQVWAMVELQRMTGMRSGEAVIMRACDIDTEGEIWEYRPASHKGQHLGRERVVPLGPHAQAIVREFLKPDTQAYLFSPADAEADRRADAHQQRKTPLSCGNRPGTNRSKKPGRPPGERYTPDTYRRAIARACELANVPNWHPHQLRHSSGTKVRKQYGLEAAQVHLGHAKADVTQIYAEKNLDRAREIAWEIG